MRMSAGLNIEKAAERQPFLLPTKSEQEVSYKLRLVADPRGGDGAA